VTFLLR